MCFRNAIALATLSLAIILMLPSFAVANDSYPMENMDARVFIEQLSPYHTSGVAQTFTATGGSLESAELGLAITLAGKSSPPASGSLVVNIYPCDEAGGITGSSVATSNSRAVSTMNLATHRLESFTFATPPELVDGQTYLLALEGTGVSRLEASIDASEPTHPGVCLTYDIWAESWIPQDYDLIFYVHQSEAPANPPATATPASSVWSIFLLIGVASVGLVSKNRDHRDS